MRTTVHGGVIALVLMGLAGCKFDSSGHHTDGPTLRPPAETGAGGSAGALQDASTTPKSDAVASMDAGAVTGSDANVGDGAIPNRDDANIDSGFGDNPTPDDPDAGPLQGGLKCGDTFCPFAAPPVEPCCTSAGDLETGAARELDQCGLNFSKAGSDFYGAQCWQRDQPGVVDDSCPAVQVDLHTSDPGCCSDRGTCGGVDTENGLGCHVDPGVEAQSCGNVSHPDGGTTAQCDLTGQYALVIDVDMAWGGRSGGLWELTDDGRGTLRIQILATVDDVDPDTRELRGMIKPCGVQLPTFYSSTLCEAYEPVFPITMWESKWMPAFPMDGRAQCLEPGCLATIDAQTVLLGIELANPEAPWPTASETASITCPAGKGAKCFPDHDGDGRAGLTVEVAKTGMGPASTTCRRGYTKRGAPLSSSVAAIFDGVRRTDRIMLGVRMKVGSTVTLGDECSTGSGSGIAEFVNSRGWGCLVQPGTANVWGRPAGANDPCTASEASFMDANLPIYTVLDVGQKPSTDLELTDTSASKGPLTRLVRLGSVDDEITCEDVRSAMLPP